MEQIKLLPLEDLHPPNFDCRLSTNEEKDLELQESVRELGILEPLIVKQIKKGYEVIIGSRRLCAAGIVGLPSAPCIVIKASGEKLEKIKIHENIKRDDLSHIDQAYTFVHLIEEYKMTEDQIAKLIGKSVAYVSQHLTLISANDKLIAGVRDGAIPFSTARELIRVKNIDERERLQDQIERHGASVDVVRSWVNESNREVLGTSPEGNHYTPTSESPPNYKTTYPCQACGGQVEVSQLRIARLCPECHYQIFSAIKEQLEQISKENPK